MTGITEDNMCDVANEFRVYEAEITEIKTQMKKKFGTDEFRYGEYNGKRANLEKRGNGFTLKGEDAEYPQSLSLVQNMLAGESEKTKVDKCFLTLPSSAQSQIKSNNYSFSNLKLNQEQFECIFDYVEYYFYDEESSFTFSNIKFESKTIEIDGFYTNNIKIENSNLREFDFNFRYADKIDLVNNSSLKIITYSSYSDDSRIELNISGSPKLTKKTKKHLCEKQANWENKTITLNGVPIEGCDCKLRYEASEAELNKKLLEGYPHTLKENLTNCEINDFWSNFFSNHYSNEKYIDKRKFKDNNCDDIPFIYNGKNYIIKNSNSNIGVFNSSGKQIFINGSLTYGFLGTIKTTIKNNEGCIIQIKTEHEYIPTPVNQF